MLGLNRREFIWLTGAAGGALALAPRLREDAPVEAIPEIAPGVETETRTTCLMCPGGCGITVRQIDGSPVSIRGNPSHPLNAGGICSEGMAALQLLYHPDRILQPMKRPAGDRTAPLAPVSWDEALQEITNAMKGLRARSNSEKLAFVLGRRGGSMEELVTLFMNSWGSPNLFLDEPQDGYLQIFDIMHGLQARPAFDFENADFILSFGADLLEAWNSPLQFQRSFASFRTPSRSSPAKLVVADVRFSRTAARADDWIGIASGSYGALALGIAYVMLREKLYDAEFAEQHLYGLEDFRDASGKLRLGFRTLVLRDYSPEVVSRLTGVAMDKILALGKAFGESARALSIFGEGVTGQPGGLHGAMAIHALNLLKGNINLPGGIYLQPKSPLAPLSSSLGDRSESPEERLVEELTQLDGKELPEILFLYYSNPIYSSTFRQKLADILAKVPLVVSFSPFLDETSRFVDYQLPDALFLERWEDRLFPSTFPAAGWGIVQPCVQPAGETRHAGDVLLTLARMIGAPLAEAFPWQNFEELLKHRAQGLHEARAGTFTVQPFQQGLVAEMERRGWWTPSTATFEEFWQSLLESGAWTDPNYQIRSLEEYSGHPDGRIDLYSRALVERMTRSEASVEDTECLPHFHPADLSRVSIDFPMTLHPVRLCKPGGGTSAMLPWILQGAGALHNLAWNSWAEIHPADAQALGIRNLDWIWLESAIGKIKLRAVVYPGAGRNVVNVPTGFGHHELGRWARSRGVNPFELVAAERDPFSRLPYRFGTKVKIYKA